MLQIVGVVGDENTAALDEAIRPAVYFPDLQGRDEYLSLVVRTAREPGSLAAALRAQVRALDPQVSIYGLRTMEEVIAESPAAFLRRYPAFLMGAFAAIALLMATIGTYGMVAYAVAQRRHEIGIRIALGAQRRDIFGLVIGQGMLLVAGGVAVGLAGAALATRALGKLLFGVAAFDPVTYAAAAAVLMGTALAAAYFPALRATRVAPGTTLGSE
jgi:putative ABC transport system permease protein